MIRRYVRDRPKSMKIWLNRKTIRIRRIENMTNGDVLDRVNDKRTMIISIIKKNNSY